MDFRFEDQSERPMRGGRNQMRKRRGAATLDYVLVLGAAFSMSGALVYFGGTMIKLVHEMIHVMIGWPFM
jgi:hypothetical protein